MTTTTRAQTLAERFEAANAEVIAAVEGFDRGTAAHSRDEGWPLPFTAWHIADGYGSVMGLITLAAEGQPLPPITREMLDAGNAANLAAHGACTREEAAAALRRHGADTASAIQALTDEQLERSAVLDLFGGATLTVELLIEGMLIGHTRGHLTSLQAAS